MHIQRLTIFSTAAGRKLLALTTVQSFRVYAAVVSRLGSDPAHRLDQTQCEEPRVLPTRWLWRKEAQEGTSRQLLVRIDSVVQIWRRTIIISRFGYTTVFDTSVQNNSFEDNRAIHLIATDRKSHS